MLKEKTKVTERRNLDAELNAVRAGVLGSNDGILTVVGVLFSLGAATTNQWTWFIAALTDLLACALSMSAGEYASVSAQADAEKVALKEARELLAKLPKQAHAQISDFYQQRGLQTATADQIATDLMKKKPLGTLLWIRDGLIPGEFMNPWVAAGASFIAALLGGSLPLVTMWLTPNPWKFFGTIVATVVAVGLTGVLSAQLGHGFVKRAVYRNIAIGLITICLHYLIGLVF